MNLIDDPSLISLLPVVVVVVMIFVTKQGKRSKYLIMGFLALTTFYIFAPDPSVIAYTSGGNYGIAIQNALISAVALVVAVFGFKKGLTGGDS